MMFGGVMFTPDRFVGGDDPATVIRTLVARENDMHIGNMRLLTFVAALIKQNGGELKIEKETMDALSPRFGIHHRHDATGSIILAVVPISNQMLADATGEQNEAAPEHTTDEPKDDASN